MVLMFCKSPQEGKTLTSMDAQAVVGQSCIQGALWSVLLFCLTVTKPTAACMRTESSSSVVVDGGQVPVTISPHAKMQNCTANEARSAQCVNGNCYVTELDGHRNPPACECYPGYGGLTCKFRSVPSPTEMDTANIINIVIPVVIVILVAISIVVLWRLRVHRRCCRPSANEGRVNLESGSDSTKDSEKPEGKPLLMNGLASSPATTRGPNMELLPAGAATNCE